MAEINQFGSAKPVRSGEGTSCAECEAMLMDALDGALSAKDRAAFDRHIATCAECSQMLEDAKRGATMLEVLKFYRPEPSTTLFDRILAQTSGLLNPAAAPVKSQNSGIIAIPGIDGGAVEIHSIVPTAAASTGSPAYAGYAPTMGKVLPFRSQVAATLNLRAVTHTLMQPRLAMTAAMAFFSIALTLNLTGVHLNELRASDLAPSNIKRSFYHANASVVRYYDNLRVVYELESRVQDLKRSNDTDGPSSDAAPAAKGSPEQSPAGGSPNGAAKSRKAPKSGSGTSQRRGIEERSPISQEFKLARYLGVARDAPTFVGNRALVATNSQLKESSRKGELV